MRTNGSVQVMLELPHFLHAGAAGQVASSKQMKSGEKQGVNRERQQQELQWGNMLPGGKVLQEDSALQRREEIHPE